MLIIKTLHIYCAQMSFKLNSWLNLNNNGIWTWKFNLKINIIIVIEKIFFVWIQNHPSNEYLILDELLLPTFQYKQGCNRERI